MHGSPLARESNLRIWDFFDFNDFDVIDATLSFQNQACDFFTDTGRTFGASKANLRDHIYVETTPALRSSRELCSFIGNRVPQLLYLSVHPERWTDAPMPWVKQWGWDITANTVKHLIAMVRAT